MGKVTIYHGTVTGKDDVFLESFIVCGGAKGNIQSRDYSDQSPGFYVDVGFISWANTFSDHRAPEEAARREETDLRSGRGMIVVLQAELDARNWEFDHESDVRHSMAVLRGCKHLLGALDFGEEGAAEAFGLDATKRGFSVSYAPPDGGRPRSVKVNWASKEPFLFTYPLSKIHGALASQFPGEYFEAKEKVLRDVEKEGGTLKYTSNAPIRVDKIYLRPLDESGMEDTIDDNTLREKWTLACDAASTAGRAPARNRQSDKTRRLSSQP